MSDSCRRTLRTWAVLELVFGLAFAALCAAALPWKTPVLNLVGVGFGVVTLAAAPGLWGGRLWGHRLALATGLVGLALGVAAVTALFASWGYLGAIYGGAGAGASVVVLLLAGLAFQWLGLYPALKLRALLRREVRAGVGAGRGRGVAGAAVAMAVIPIVVAGSLRLGYALAPAPRVPEPARAEVMAALRAALGGRAAPRPSAELAAVPLGPGPLAVTVWAEGAARARIEASGGTLADAVQSAARELAGRVARDPSLARGRLKVDRTAAVGPVLGASTSLLGLSLDPGLDALATTDGRPFFWPDDLLRAGAFGAAPLLPSLQELRLGVSGAWLRGQMAGARGLGGIKRFRTESWIETPSGPAAVHRGRVETRVPEPREAASAAAGFILRQLGPDGRFRYRYDPYTNEELPGAAYNLPRHAGTIYSLARLYGMDKDPRIADAARAAIGFLAQQIPPVCGDAGRACVVEGDRAGLGASALAAIALLEHQRRTGEGSAMPVARRLVAFLMSAQRPDGTFEYLFDPGAGVFVPSPPRMFAAEEAAFAFTLAHELWGDEAMLRAAERALDHLTGPKYRPLLGRFVYGAEAWTCLAAEEAYPALAHARYDEFCRGYARFLRRLQFQPDPDATTRDFAGHYGFTPFVVPQAAGTAGLTEGVLAAYGLSRARGAPDAELRAQAALSVGALARDQIRADNGYLARDVAAASGAIRRSLAEHEVRIDFVQHAATAFVRAEELGVGAL